MGTQYKNRPTEQAARELEEQLRARDAMTGSDLFTGDEAAARAELDRLDREIQVGHGRPTNKKA